MSTMSRARASLRRFVTAPVFFLLFALLLDRSAFAASRLVWDKQRERVDAEITSWPVDRLLERVATATGWQIFIEPQTAHIVSTKFKNLPPGEALRKLLGDLNFALVPQGQGPAKLFVFQTTMQRATQLIEASPKEETEAPKPIANQLVVRLKPGASIEDLARELGAKIVGRLPGLNAYLLEFPDEETTELAREKLKTNNDVAAIESNYAINRPTPADPLALSYSQPLTLQPKAVGASDRVVVGLIDTAIQKQGGKMDGFLLDPISVVEGAKPTANMPTHATAMWETILRGLSIMLDGETASKVRVLPVDVYGDRVNSSTFDVANGIYRAINAGAMIINLSLGTDGDTPLLHQVIKSGHDQGVVFFAAAGNEPVTTPTYPAAYTEPVAVTAGDQQGRISSYANRGSFIDAIAPGSALINFNNQSFVVMGTSAATAYASGMAAGLVDTTGKGFTAAEAAIRQMLAPKRPTLGK